MPIFETFAKRKQKVENAGKLVIYSYDQLPEAFRVQVIHILRSEIPDPRIWELVHSMMAREMGVFDLAPSLPITRRLEERCEDFILNDDDVDQVLSIIEIFFRGINDNATTELNHRFREHAIGYQYQGDQIIQVDSQYLHSEAVGPALSLLHTANFEGASQEFLRAHEHYRKGNYKEALVNAASAFESTMKTICDKRGWNYDPKKATASGLTEILFNNNLIPSELKSHYGGLRSVLESGVPTIRNQPGQGAHGQGGNPIEVPEYLASYVLHLTASNIVFLVEAHNAKNK